MHSQHHRDGLLSHNNETVKRLEKPQPRSVYILRGRELLDLPIYQLECSVEFLASRLVYVSARVRHAGLAQRHLHVLSCVRRRRFFMTDTASVWVDANMRCNATVPLSHRSSLLP